MARLRFMAVALLALAFAGNPTQTGRSQSQTTTVERSQYYFGCGPTTKPCADDRSCVMYSLTDMGYDADLGKWIAQTIPEMIEPSSWQQQGGLGVLRYYAPKNILIVKQSTAIQGKVDGFLKDLKVSMPKGSATYISGLKPASASVVPAEYHEPGLLRTSNPVPEPSSYPVPSAVKPPKHLFHFIIRYEGEGIIDDNVVKFMKLQGQGEKPAAAAPMCQPSAVAPIVSEAPPTPPAPGYSPAPTVAGTPAPAVTLPDQPSKSPKKKKGKKDEHEEKPGNVAY